MVAYPEANDQTCSVRVAGCPHSLFSAGDKRRSMISGSPLAGSGQPITDPFSHCWAKGVLAWNEAPPLQGRNIYGPMGSSTCLRGKPGRHQRTYNNRGSCSVKKANLRARMLDHAELAEHQNMVAEATKHMSIVQRHPGRRKVSRAMCQCRRLNLGTPSWPSCSDTACKIQPTNSAKLERTNPRQILSVMYSCARELS